MVSIFKDVNVWKIIGGEMWDRLFFEFFGFFKIFIFVFSFLVSWVEKGRNWRENFCVCFFRLCLVVFGISRFR